nr:glycosyltransferase [uncultured Duncaniella sp.]
MKVLYIYPKPQEQQAGLERVNIRNRELLEQSMAEVKTFEVPLTTKVQTFIGLLEGYCGGIRYKRVKEIFSILDEEPVDVVFLWSSKSGKLAKQIANRFHQIKIVTFFHNVEIQYGEEELKIAPSLKNRFINLVVRSNERHAVENSNSLITMNQRDNMLLKRYYNRTADLILPLGMSDVYLKSISPDRFNNTNIMLKLIFVGSAFFANIDGLEWLLQNVFSKLSNVELLIIGKNMDKHFTQSYDDARNARVKVSGYVEDLEEVYEQCHIVISPIFHGGGMKTKTAEAMMYGCPIIGSKEAFEGYDVDYNQIGAQCNTAKEFIDAINRMRTSEVLIQCARYARNIFLRKYETNALSDKMSYFLSSMA